MRYLAIATTSRYPPQHSVPSGCSVLMRCKVIQRAAVIRSTVLRRCFATQPASTTRLVVLKRSHRTLPASTIRPPVFKRSTAIQSARSILRWGIRPAPTSPRAVTILISATLAWQESPIRCESARGSKPPPISQVLVGSLWQMAWE